MVAVMRVVIYALACTTRSAWYFESVVLVIKAEF